MNFINYNHKNCKNGLSQTMSSSKWSLFTAQNFLLGQNFLCPLHQNHPFKLKQLCLDRTFQPHLNSQCFTATTFFMHICIINSSWLHALSFSHNVLMTLIQHLCHQQAHPLLVVVPWLWCLSWWSLQWLCLHRQHVQWYHHWQQSLQWHCLSILSLSLWPLQIWW